jgi:hypothetical protein
MNESSRQALTHGNAELGLQSRVREEAAVPRPRILQTEQFEEYCALVRQGLAQYGMTIADLADQQPRARTKEDLTLERVGVQERASTSLANQTREQIRRFVDNTLRRASSFESAIVVIGRLMNSTKAHAWRRANRGGPDPWSDRVSELRARGIPYVIAIGPHERGEACAFIHPKMVEGFVATTLDDCDVWLTPSLRGKLEHAMVQSIRARSRDRANALANWVAMSEGCIDVRVYEGPETDPETGATLPTSQLRFRRVRPGSHSPFGPGDREPRAHERMKAIMEDAIADTGAPTAFVSYVAPPMRLLGIHPDGQGGFIISTEWSDPRRSWTPN